MSGTINSIYIHINNLQFFDLRSFQLDLTFIFWYCWHHLHVCNTIYCILLLLLINQQKSKFYNIRMHEFLALKAQDIVVFYTPLFLCF